MPAKGTSNGLAQFIQREGLHNPIKFWNGIAGVQPTEITPASGAAVSRVLPRQIPKLRPARLHAFAQFVQEALSFDIARGAARWAHQDVPCTRLDHGPRSFGGGTAFFFESNDVKAGATPQRTRDRSSRLTLQSVCE
jgi:hypothetical protein